METLADIGLSRYPAGLNEFNAVPVSNNQVLNRILERDSSDEGQEQKRRSYNEINQLYAAAMTDHSLDTLFLTTKNRETDYQQIAICFKPKTTLLEKLEIVKPQYDKRYDKNGKTNSACASGGQDCYRCVRNYNDE